MEKCKKSGCLAEWAAKKPPKMIDRISDEQLDWLIHDCQYDGIQTEVNLAGRDDGRDYDCDDLVSALQELKERREAEQPAEKKLKLAIGPYDIKPGTIIIYDEYGPMPKVSDLEKLTGQKWGRE